ncbi:hypothetical protein D9615_004991 [Tricholomella constricta]|uniref:Uncharacterized protein n=1 Tax=Tricholomella constricta TaxID=117010 RepID=A0A8H5M757_9AGAR|nr:hypothetical protein D9615_004991 [Tricholomella constricta]
MSTTMDAVLYHAAHQLEIVKREVPQIAEDEVLLKVTCCGVCGSDHHLAELVPGHEIVGTVAAVGKSVISGVVVGDRCVVDPVVLCENCFFCRRGQHVLCENFNGLGVTLAGGFAEYVAVQSKKVYKIDNLTDEEATLVEPAACAIHGLDKLNAPVGVEVLVLGAGPTGLILAQLLKLNGASRVVIAANKSIKTRVAQELDCGDEYIELDRVKPEPQWEQLKSSNPYGFDVVIEATGSEKMANDAIHLVRRGGTLMIYGVYANSDLVHWAPSKIFGDEIRIIGSFAQTHCFPRAVEYLNSGKIRVKGMVTDTFAIKDYQKALDKMNSKEAVKVAVKP